MRLQQYLNEGINEDRANEIIKLIEKDCQPFLKQMKASNFINEDLLFSGRRRSSYDNVGFEKKKVRKNRKPKDTPEDIHEWVDNWFYENFGIRARSNAMFCTGNANDARAYGRLFVVFPIGKFEIIGSSLSKDLFNQAIMDKGLEYGKENFLSQDSKSYRKGNLQKAIRSKNEIMLHCKEYYILDYHPISSVIVLNHFEDTLK